MFVNQFVNQRRRALRNGDVPLFGSSSVRSSVCRLKRVLLMPAGAYRIGHSGCTDLLRSSSPVVGYERKRVKFGEKRIKDKKRGSGKLVFTDFRGGGVDNGHAPLLSLHNTWLNSFILL